MNLKQKLHNDEPIFGTMLRIVRNPAVVPLAKTAGLDFVMFDVEHGAYAMEDLANLALVGNSLDFPVLARVPELSRAWVSGALDTGLAGVMVPMIESAAQANQLVAWSKYPPLGTRGFCSAGGHTAYTKPPNIAAHLRETNERILTIAQIETRDGVDHADAIAGTPGIDVILAGPADLSVSIGKPGQMDSAEELAALERIAAAVQTAGSVLGTHCGTDLLDRMIALGLKFFMFSLDIAILEDGFRTALRIMQQHQQARKDGNAP